MPIASPPLDDLRIDDVLKMRNPLTKAHKKNGDNLENVDNLKNEDNHALPVYYQLHSTVH